MWVLSSNLNEVIKRAMWILRKVHFRQREQPKCKALRWEPLGEFKSSKACVWGTVTEEGIFSLLFGEENAGGQGIHRTDWMLLQSSV